MADKLTPEQLEQIDAYFRSRYGLFEVASGHQTSGHGIAEWSLTTEEKQGIHIYQQGNMKVSSNISMELRTGHFATPSTGHMVISCENGDVVIDAPNGNLILSGKNVQIESTDAKGAVTINSPRNIQGNAPAIKFDTGAATTNMSGSSLYCLASDVNTYGHNSNEISEGVSDIVDGSLLQKIIGAIEKIKMFFKSICG